MPFKPLNKENIFYFKRFILNWKSSSTNQIIQGIRKEMLELERVSVQEIPDEK